MQTNNNLLQQYFQSLKEGQVQLPYCCSCKRHHFPPRILCPHCHNDDIAWQTIDPVGTIFTFTTAFGKRDSETCIVLVEVFPRVRLLGQLTERVNRDTAIIGRKVKGEIVYQENGEVMLRWRLTDLPQKQ